MDLQETLKEAETWDDIMHLINHIETEYNAIVQISGRTHHVGWVRIESTEYPNKIKGEKLPKDKKGGLLRGLKTFDGNGRFKKQTLLDLLDKMVKWIENYDSGNEKVTIKKVNR